VLVPGMGAVATTTMADGAHSAEQASC
jgi:hypothetical protein